MPKQSQHSYNADVASGGLKPAAQTENLKFTLTKLGDNLGCRMEWCRQMKRHPNKVKKICM